MGDYYKIKKILLILIIVLTIIRIFKTSNVFASEAVEVTPTWNDGNYTYISDNQFLSLRQNQLDIQQFVILSLYNMYDNAPDSLTRDAIVDRIKNIYDNIYNTNNYGRNAVFVWFGRLITSSLQSNFYYQIVKGTQLSSITYADATLDSGYKVLSVPFYSFSRTSTTPCRYIHASDGSIVNSLETGTALVPVAELGVYNEHWVDLFEYVGLLGNSNVYEDILASIEETNQLNYTQNYYTKQAVQNTYNYLTNDSIEEITSLGISQPEISENIDLTDVFDSLESLLTNEDYTSKYFTFSLPGNRNFNFTLRPDYLETSLTRVGGSSIISIIHALWYIGLYGWYIFAYLGIFGKLITGDLFHLVKGCSPVTNLVKMSVGSITGGKY